MKAEARLSVERDPGGRTVVRDLHRTAPLALIPARTNGSALVHLVNSAAGPLGGDDLTLTVHVGPGATLALRAIAATVALPGPHGHPSRSTVRLSLSDGARLDYHPEPTVVTTRAVHESNLVVTLAGDARLRTRELLVLGRTGERPGTLTTRTDVTRDGRPVLRQHLRIGDPGLDASIATLAGRRVLATGLNLDGSTPAPAGGEWWSRTPLAAGGSITTALADDAVTALRLLELGEGDRSGFNISP